MNDVMTSSQRADALEEKMMQELSEAIAVKSRLFLLADGDFSRPTAPRCKRRGRARRC
jgi:hypothetical protein